MPVRDRRRPSGKTPLIRCNRVLFGTAAGPSVASMVEIGKPLLAVYVAAALAVALIGARYLQGQALSESGSRSGTVSLAAGGAESSGARGAGATGSAVAYPPRGRLVLHVTGAVRRPGLVEADDGDRVGDAIRLAGGALRVADLTAVNLALRVADGQQIVVPRRGARIGGGGASTVSGPISLNTATAEQLDTLDGVGPGLAAKIVGAREQRGGFRSVDDLADVPGIGEKRLESLRGQLQP